MFNKKSDECQCGWYGFILHLDLNLQNCAKIIIISFLFNFTLDVERGVIHCFELRTANVDYFVGEEPVGKKNGTPVITTPVSGTGNYLAKVI